MLHDKAIQRNISLATCFYDHIIRNEPDLNRIRQYVQTNRARWQADTLYD